MAGGELAPLATCWPETATEMSTANSKNIGICFIRVTLLNLTEPQFDRTHRRGFSRCLSPTHLGNATTISVSWTSEINSRQWSAIARVLIDETSPTFAVADVFRLFC